MMKYSYLIHVMFLGCFAFAKAQSTQPAQPVKVDSVKQVANDFYYLDGDSVKQIELDEVMLLQRLKFKSEYEQIKYAILKRKVRKVWPYAKLAAERLIEIEKRLDAIDSPRKKRQYTKMVEDYIQNEFTAELKKLSMTEGQILIKLIHRQTGNTSYELVKQMRSGWSAFWFNTTANMFDMSLKTEYNPSKDVEDFYIEDILLNEFKFETLPFQEAATDINYIDGLNNWKTFENSLPADYDKTNLAAREERIKKYLEKKAKKDAKAKRKADRRKAREN
ncbi:MAG: DUF4294 domain-containing protein [Nonlabens sp.]|nr:DUF4294 domain-containing protein [Nonlabens sp.]